MSSHISRLILSLGLILVAMGCVVELTPKEAVIQTPDVSDDETGTTGDSDPAETLPDPDAIVTLNCPVPTPCRNQGICAGVQAPVCQEDGTWQCFHDTVDGFEDTELTCDGQDNDCDGTTDEDILIGTWPDCGGETAGVCGDGAPARCIDAEMVCDYSTITDYEADETLCDGKDNDCDGTTDEVTGTAISACSLQGVCALIPEIECVGGQWNCNASSYDVPKLEPDVELSCDGLDNDCDGDIDEDIIDLGASTCPQEGVCSGATGATCNNGNWACDTSLVTDYEAVETQCDGKDNDCDGLTDEGVIVVTADCDETAKAKAVNGVCQTLSTGTCIGGQAHCIFDELENYESVENTCDGLDNDCDGLTDEELAAPPTGTCSTLGECGFGLNASCELGQWTCTYTSSDHESGTETLCDGKDNDCDGLVDEDIVGGPANCPGSDTGVCKGAPILASCYAGNWICDYEAVNHYEDAAETSCDGKDNDCDGLVDEEIYALSASDCKQAGVCAIPNKVQAACLQGGNGSWTCDYAALGELYEGDAESSCDAKDNDCDGVVDEDIVDPTGAFCNNVGVCEGAVEAVCVNGAYECNFGGADGFQNPEVSCDQIDNNCDGMVDVTFHENGNIGVCPSLSSCSHKDQCVSGICREAPDGETTYCVDAANLCPSQEGDLQKFVGDSSCVSFEQGGIANWYVSTCTVNGWETPLDAPCASGACADGQCKTCVPQMTSCDETETILLTCDSTGDEFVLTGCPNVPLPTSCRAGYPGICLLHADLQLDPAAADSDALSGTITRGSQGHIMLAMQTNAGSSDYTVAGQLMNANAVPTTSSFITPTGLGALAPDIVSIDTTQTAAFIWQAATEADAGDIRMRLISFTTGQLNYPVIPVNQTTVLEQSNPQLARRVKTTNGVMTVWQAQGQVNGSDIVARSFNISPTKQLSAATNEIVVNSTTDGEQHHPKIARLDNLNFVIGWNDDLNNNNGKGVYGRLLTDDGTLSAEQIQFFESPTGNQQDLDLAAMANGSFLATWTTSQNEDEDIMFRRFSNDGTPLTGEILATKEGNGLPKVGSQRTPAVAVLPGERFVLAWEDSSSPADSNGSGVVVLQFDADLTPRAIRQVNNDNGFIVGHQRKPQLVASGTLQAPWVLVLYEHSELNGQGHTGLVTRPIVLEP